MKVSAPGLRISLLHCYNFTKMILHKRVYSLYTHSLEVVILEQQQQQQQQLE
jgi:hypothetical protein